MNTRNSFIQAMATMLLIACSQAAQAADVNGVWISDISGCSKTFEKRGDRVSFAKVADTYGGGFIIEDDQIRGKFATCTVQARKQQGDVVNILAVCSTDVAIHTSQFSLRIVGPNKIIREFPGMPGMSMSYERCSL